MKLIFQTLCFFAYFTTPIMKGVMFMMNDLQKQLTDNIFTKLKEQCKGKITTYVDKDDALFMRATNGDFTFEKRIDNISNLVYNGVIDSDKLVDLFVNEMKLEVIRKTVKHFFN